MLKNPDPSLINADLAPTAPEGRTWKVHHMASLWIGMVVCVPTYMLAGGLIGLGMNWWQAVLTVMLGNLIVLIPMVLNGHAGTKYGVPFPVLSRASFGIAGAHVPSVLRGLVACGWFGVQTWVGGSAIYHLLGFVSSDLIGGADIGWLGINAVELICYLAFWVLQVAVLWKGIDSIKILETFAAPFLVIMGLVLLAWAYRNADGFGAMLSTPSAFDEGGPKEGQFWSVFFPSLTGMVGFWATLSLNIPDFTRYAKTQRDQVLGQAIGLPLFMGLFAFISVAVTSATVVIFDRPVSDPTELVGVMDGGFAVILSLAALAIATLSTNLAANVVSPANAIINLAPSRITFRRAAMVTTIIGISIFPWKIIEDPDAYIFTWLVGYSALLGPIGGIVIADYFVVRRTQLDLDSLYRRDGAYAYMRGVNPVAIVALLIGIAPNIPGFLGTVREDYAPAEIWSTLFDFAWFIGFGLSAATYVIGMRLTSRGEPSP